MRGLDVANRSDAHHRRRLNDSHRLYDLFLVDLCKQQARLYPVLLKSFKTTITRVSSGNEKNIKIFTTESRVFEI